MNGEGLVCEGAHAVVEGETLLRDVHLQLAPARLTAIVGPNGAGKSTLLSLLSGERRPRRGRVLLDGVALAQMPMVQHALRRAVMAQETAVSFDYLVRDVVELGRYPHRQWPDADEVGILEQAMTLTGVVGLADRVFNSLSGGEKARVHLARVLAQVWAPRPGQASRWLLLDEPTAALDLAHQHQVLRLLRRRAREDGLGVVAVLHDLNLALRYADTVVLVAGAALQAVGPAHETLSPACVRAVWGVACGTAVAADGTPQYLFG